MEEIKRVASFFDGMSCGQIALERIGIIPEKYYASEIDKYAISITQKNYPNTIQLGDINKIDGHNLKNIDLFIGGSPCQGFSKAGKQLNFNNPRSKLFFQFIRILKQCKPKYFLLENVKMKEKYQDIISNYLGVKPIQIDSALLSAQRRTRLYWTNISKIVRPIDKEINLSDVLQSGDVDRDKSYCLDANYFKGTNAKQYLTKCRRQIVWVIPEATKRGYVEVSPGERIDLTFIKSKTRRGRLMIKKSNCLTATVGNFCKVTNDWFRKFTPIECERLQTVPDNYTQGVSNSQRYKMLGNGWTVDVIAHIFKSIKDDKTKSP